MILGYTLPNAEMNITSGVKKHSLRDDKKGRWKIGRFIDHATGVRTKNYRCFHASVCTGVQSVLLVLTVQRDVFDKNKKHCELFVTIDRRRMQPEQVKLLAENDGFENVFDFIKWFFPKDKNNEYERTMWSGKIIHWTDLKY